MNMLMQCLQLRMVLLLIMATIILGCTISEDVPSQEQYAQAIEKGIMCPVCPGESIDQSRHPLSIQMRSIVTEKLDQGWTEKQIDAFFVERYGPSVLLDPPRDGVNLLVWLVPPFSLAVAFILLYFSLRSMARFREVAAELTDNVDELSGSEKKEYFRRIKTAFNVQLLEGDEDDKSDGHG